MQVPPQRKLEITHKLTKITQFNMKIAKQPDNAVSSSKHANNNLQKQPKSQINLKI